MERRPPRTVCGGRGWGVGGGSRQLFCVCVNNIRHGEAGEGGGVLAVRQGGADRYGCAASPLLRDLIGAVNMLVLSFATR